MCLITFNWQPSSERPLVMAANRDEFHQRPARPAQFWDEHPNLMAGKDLEAGGTWMGITRTGRFAALTNVRKLPAPYKGTISRGKLVSDYLNSEITAEAYLNQIAQNPKHYDGFNLIVGDAQSCWYYSNYSDTQTPSIPQALAPGLYGLSNHQLNTPWPKVEHAKQALQNWITEQGSIEQLSALLSRRETFPDDQLPDTGIGMVWERMLSAPFIISPEYGTRAGTGLILEQTGIQWMETTYTPDGKAAGIVKTEF